MSSKEREIYNNNRWSYKLRIKMLNLNNVAYMENWNQICMASISSLCHGNYISNHEGGIDAHGYCHIYSLLRSR